MAQRDGRITALIPAAGRAPDGVLALSNVTSPAMIPVAGRPVIQWTLQYLQGLGIETVKIAVASRGLFVEEFVDCLFGHDLDIEYVVPSRDGGVGVTVAELAERVTTPSTLVVLGDTHFELADPELLASDEPAILVGDVDESYRWCVADVSSDGFVKGLRDKEPGLPPPLKALVGVYWFPDASRLRQATADALGSASDRVELSDILEEVARTDRIRAVPAGTWLDCGNPDRQAESQRVLLEQRAFNELSVDATFGTITKRSTHIDKFTDEINFLRLLPPDLAVLFPRVLEASTDREQPSLTMEFYGYPTLAELFVFENVDPGIWRRIFEHLRDVITQGFMRHQHPVSREDVDHMLLGKVLQRVTQLGAGPVADLAAADGPVDIDGKAVSSFDDLLPLLRERVAELAANAQGTVIHGDLCFSNVLYDLRSGVCKFVDPRGSFGRAGLYGDPRYDVAKLYHSVYGLYDFITADLFEVEVDDEAGKAVTLGIRTRAYHQEICDEFDDVFFPLFDRDEILLFTGLIFLGLPALHYDHPKRQLAFWVRGLQLLDEVLTDS